MRIPSTLLTAMICLISAGCGADSAATSTTPPPLNAGGGGPGPAAGGGPGGVTPGPGGVTPGPGGVTPGPGGVTPGPGGVTPGPGGVTPGPGGGGAPAAIGGMPGAGGGAPPMNGGATAGGGAPPMNGGAAAGGAPAPGGTDADKDGRPAMAAKPADNADGSLALYDCNDADGTIFRGAPEVCGDGKDNNCDGMMDEAECIPAPGNVACEDLTHAGKMYARCGKGQGLWTQPKARLVCLAKGMDLAKIDDDAENEFIRGNINDQTWVSGSDEPETHKSYLAGSPTGEKWRWGVTGNVFFTGKATAGKAEPGAFAKWGTTGANPPQQPNNQVGSYDGRQCREGCMVVRTTQNGSWYDICCNNRTGDGFCEAR